MSALFGIQGIPGENIAQTIFFGLFHLQHRGQKETVIAVSKDGIKVLQKPGLVNQIKESEIKGLEGSSGVGIILSSPSSFLLSQEEKILGYDGKIFKGNSLENLEGVGSFLILKREEIIAAKDPLGLRPLSVGKLPTGQYLFSSESCSIENLGGSLIRELDPGEILTLRNGQLYSRSKKVTQRKAFCIFEFISFSHPVSNLFGQSVYSIRRRIGEVLALKAPEISGVYGPVPRAASPIAIGFCQKRGVSFSIIFIQNHYIYSLPVKSIFPPKREFELNPLEEIVKGKDIVLIDEAVVYGEGARRRIFSLKNVNAKSISLFVASPPVLYPCFAGIGENKKPIASFMDQEEIKEYLGVDSLFYLPLGDLIEAIGKPKGSLCTYCLDGEDPRRFLEGV